MRTVRRTVMTQLTVAFRSFANAHKKLMSRKLRKNTQNNQVDYVTSFSVWVGYAKNR